MAKNIEGMNPKVDFYFNKAGQWQEAFQVLRTIVLSCPLTESLKWGHPCYAHEEHNIVLIHGFKEYCALLFMKGALLKDPKGILIQQTAQVQSARQIRFTQVRDITKHQSALKDYIREAIAVERAGQKVTPRATRDFPVAPEFQKKLKEMPALKSAFEALTPGRQRGYLLYFSSAKQSQTRESRVEKCLPLIREGKGLDD
jgi:uncharacterized protein YdeI (YjbR/CyaY-like superfamily)